MSPRRILAYYIGFILLIWGAAFFAGCGNVESARGGAGGEAGTVAPDVRQDASAAAGGRGGADVDAGQGGAAAPACIDTNAPGFALNGTCDGGRPASAGCHASCQLGAAAYVGCVSGNAFATVCYAGCGACP